MGKQNSKIWIKLWNARHNAYFAAHALVPGVRVFVTDTCGPIFHLAGCIAEAKNDLAYVSFPQPLSARGDGNFAVLCVLDPINPFRFEEASR